jgi:sugar phosphate isomerase/epimerase
MTMLQPFCFQIFSAREFPPISEQLRCVAEIGFRAIETYRDLYENPAQMRELLDQYDLSAPTGHFALAALESELERHMKAARILGIETVIVPFLPPADRATGVAGWKAIGARLDDMRKRVEAEGFGFAWHNHNWDMARLEDGSTAIQHILGEEMKWQMDVAWLARSGQDPFEWMRRYHGRICGIHFKDMARPGENEDEMGWADPGEGILPWDALWVAAIEAGASISVAEHDMPKDYVRFARKAMAQLRIFAREIA